MPTTPGLTACFRAAKVLPANGLSKRRPNSELVGWIERQRNPSNRPRMMKHEGFRERSTHLARADDPWQTKTTWSRVWRRIFPAEPEMSFFKTAIGLLAVLAASGFCAALAEDSS